MRPWRWLVSVVLLGAVLAQAGAGWRAAGAQEEVPPEEPPREYFSPAGHMGGTAVAVQLLEDDYAALALGLDLLILDVLGPYQPLQVARLSYPAPVTDLIVYGQTAYLLAGGIVHIVNLSDPTRPRKAGILYVLQYGRLLPAHANDLALAGDYLIVAGRRADVYSLENPADPQLLGSYEPTGSTCSEGAWDCMVVDGVQHAAAAYPYLYLQVRVYECIWVCWLVSRNEILDISDPANPVKLEWPQGSSGVYVRQMLALPDYWLALGYRDIRVVAAEDLSSLEPRAVLPHAAQHMALQGELLYLVDRETGLHILDVSDPLAAQLLGSETTQSDARQVAVQDNLAYVAGGTQGLAVVNVRNPQAPQYAGGFRTLGGLSQVLLDGTTLYAVSDQLEIADLSNPRQPHPLARYPLAGSPALAGSVLVLAAGETGLIAVQVSNPAAPLELDRLALPGEARDVAVVGDYAYVASSAGLQVVDMREPAALALVSAVTDFSAVRVIPGGDFLALATDGEFSIRNSSFEVRIFDLSDPSQPQQTFRYEVPNHGVDEEPCLDYPGDVRGLAADGERVFVLWDIQYEETKICSVYAGGLVVLERSSTGEWGLTARNDLFYGLLEVAVADGRIYLLASRPIYDNYTVSEPRLWMGIYDLASLPAMELLEELWLRGWGPGTASPGKRNAGLAVAGDLVALGNYQTGLYLMQYWAPEELFLPRVTLRAVEH